MSDKKPKASCGCTQTGEGIKCPCSKRICLPILGLVGIAVLASLAARAKNRKGTARGGCRPA